MPATLQSSLIFHYNLKCYENDGDTFDGVSLKRFVMQVCEVGEKGFLVGDTTSTRGLFRERVLICVNVVFLVGHRKHRIVSGSRTQQRCIFVGHFRQFSHAEGVLDRRTDEIQECL